MSTRLSLLRFSLLLLLLSVLSLLSVSQVASAAPKSPFRNLDEIARTLGLNAYATLPAPARTVKIAILDNGFRGHQAEIGKTLPASTQYHAGPIAVDPATEEVHGLFMAQLVSGLLGSVARGQLSYELHLFSAFGYSNLKNAVESVIAGSFDVVLYAQVWEYGGNGDGRGFINALVSRALAARTSTIWINAAGNFGDATYRTRIERAENDWVRLPGPNQSVRVRCRPPPKDKNKKCQLRAVLSWNDFKDDVSIGTDKDLDFVLTDDTLKILRTSGLQQKVSFPEGQPGLSLYPREIIEAEVTPGLYFLRAKIRGGDFSANDELRIVTSGDAIEQVDQTSDETLLGPADNAGVITVGASDSPKSASSRRMGKPELVFPSLVTLANGENYKGSSNSSAIATAAVAVLKTFRPDGRPELDRMRVLKLLANSGGDGSGGTGAGGGGRQPEGGRGQGLPLEILQFQPTGPGGCFLTATLPYVSPLMSTLLQRGAVAVHTNVGIKVFVGFDPFLLTPVMRRLQVDDMFVVNTQFGLYPRTMQYRLDPWTFEVVQLPKNQFYCSFGAEADNGGASDDDESSGAIPVGVPMRLPRPRKT